MFNIFNFTPFYIDKFSIYAFVSENKLWTVSLSTKGENSKRENIPRENGQSRFLAEVKVSYWLTAN